MRAPDGGSRDRFSILEVSTGIEWPAMAINPSFYYSTTTDEFIQDAEHKDPSHLSDSLMGAHFQFYDPLRTELNEVSSWMNSPRALAELLKETNITGNERIILEARLENWQRIDAIICGKGKAGDAALLLEMKQWSDRSDFVLLDSDETDCIRTINHGHENKPQKHLCIKLEEQRDSLRLKLRELFSRNEQLHLRGYAWLHNCDNLPPAWQEILHADKFNKVHKRINILTKEDRPRLINIVNKFVSAGNGDEIAEKLSKALNQGL